jgi:hypothetical protein
MKPIILSKDSVETLAAVMKNVPELQVIPCDDMRVGIRGYIAWTFDPQEEQSIWFGWRFGKPLEDTSPILDEIIGSGSDLDERVQLMIWRCINDSLNENWMRYDDPKNHILGWVKYVPLDSEQKSECVLLTLEGFKKLPKDLQNAVIAWRDRKCSDPK